MTITDVENMFVPVCLLGFAETVSGDCVPYGAIEELLVHPFYSEHKLEPLSEHLNDWPLPLRSVRDV